MIAAMNEVKTNGRILDFPGVNSSDRPEKTPKRARKNGKSEVYPFEIEDLKKMTKYFKENQPLQYMIFVLSCNLARRVSDILNLTWEELVYPDGNIRDYITIKEKKTQKMADLKINSACKDAISYYLNTTKADITGENYEKSAFIQQSGTHKGNQISYTGYLKSLKTAAEKVGITYNIGTHSARKTFGKTSRMLHPNDYDSMELLQSIFNHSDSKVTKKYIGLTKEKVDKYYDDMGDFFGDYIEGEKEYKKVASSPVISIDTNDLRDLISMAYQAGMSNSDTKDAMCHIEAINELSEMIEILQK